MDFNNLTIRRFHEGLTQKLFSVVEATTFFLDTIKKQDPHIHAYLSVREDEARASAREIDNNIKEGKETPLLAGVPCAVKDNMLLEGEVTTAASKILKTYKGTYDATTIKRLKNGSVVILGKTNLDEFAMGASTENSGFFKTLNPWDSTRVPGGSSGGSVAAVASGMAFAALGSDTGGSIRQPSAFCGVVGLKPTYGAVSRFGLIALASSLDQIGPVTRTVEDARILFDTIKGKDGYDSTTVDLQNFKSSSSVKDFVIGIPKEYFIDGLDDEVKKGLEVAMEKLKKLGFKFKEISLPHTKYAISVYYIVLTAEVSTNLARLDGVRYERARDVNTLSDVYMHTRGEGFGDEVKRRILLGTFVLSSGYYDAYYTKAQKVRRLIQQDFDEAFKQVDVIFAPTTPTIAFKMGEKSDPLSMYLADIFTCPINLAGLPSLAVPVESLFSALYSPSHLPVGFQLIGKRFHENDILSVGELYEKE